jgi:hypothetical protein
MILSVKTAPCSSFKMLVSRSPHHTLNVKAKSMYDCRRRQNTPANASVVVSHDTSITSQSTHARAPIEVTWFYPRWRYAVETDVTSCQDGIHPPSDDTDGRLCLFVIVAQGIPFFLMFLYVCTCTVCLVLFYVFYSNFIPCNTCYTEEYCFRISPSWRNGKIALPSRYGASDRLRLHLGPDLPAGWFPSLNQNRRSLSGQACAICWWATCYGTSAWQSHREACVLVTSIFPLTLHGICLAQWSIPGASSFRPFPSHVFLARHNHAEANRTRSESRSLSELSSMLSDVGGHGSLWDSLKAAEYYHVEGEHRFGICLCFRDCKLVQEHQ